MAKSKTPSKSPKTVITHHANDLTGIDLANAIKSKSKKVEKTKDKEVEISAMTSILDELDSILNINIEPPVKKAVAAKKTVPVSTLKVVKKIEKRDNLLQTEFNKLLIENQKLNDKLSTFSQMKIELEQNEKNVSLSKKQIVKLTTSLEKANVDKENFKKTIIETETLYTGKLKDSIVKIRQLQAATGDGDETSRLLLLRLDTMEKSNDDYEKRIDELILINKSKSEISDNTTFLNEELEITKFELETIKEQLESSRDMINDLKVHAGAADQLNKIKEEKTRLEKINSENSTLIEALETNVAELQNNPVISNEGSSKEIAELSKENEELRGLLSSKNTSIEEAIKSKIALYEENTKAEIAKAKIKIFESITIQILEPIGLLEATVLNSPDDPAIRSYLSGFEMISQMFYDLLSSLGVENIPVVPGDKLNSDLMETFGSMPGSGYPDGTVAKVMMKGFIKEGKVIKHTLVMVAE